MGNAVTSFMPPAVHNTEFTPEIVQEYVAASYALEMPVTSEFIRRGFNDHYLITTPPAKYVFRVYFNGKYYIAGPNDFRFELELLRYVHQQGVPVSQAVPRGDGDLLGAMTGEEGTRFCALFAYAEGKEREPLTPLRGRILGEILARFHQAADSFASPHTRYHFNLEFLAERPLALIGNIFRHYGRERDLEPFLPAITEWIAQIRALPTDPPLYGIIHGDPHSGNYRVTEDDRITLFDFDHGGYGWRAYDVSVCKGGMEEAAWQAFLTGYQSVRPLTPEELAAIPVFRKIRPIWDLGDILAMRPVWGETLPDAAYCDTIVQHFAKWTA
jgi:Ser/Thr protein kinase RdoA (MazF antagonist)